MRRILVWALSVVLCSPLFFIADATEEPLGWVQIGGGFEDDIVTGHVILEDESVVVAGKFTSAALFEEIGLGSVGINGDTDAFLGMINSSGNWTSAFNFGSLGDDGIDSIALHPSGDLVVVGHFCLGNAFPYPSRTYLCIEHVSPTIRCDIIESELCRIFNLSNDVDIA